MVKKIKMENNIVLQLREKIKEGLKKLIDNQYVLWDVPYYSNIGDVLIWNGSLEILKDIPYKCIDQASKETCTFPELSKNTIIILSGGGNLGDLYPPHQLFRKKVIKRYPSNKIIILPQSIWYGSNEIFEKEIHLFKGHRNLIICARDQISYNILSSKLGKQVMLLPDMAFGIRFENWKLHNTSNKTLFLKRLDSELQITSHYKNLENTKIDIHDWPTFEKSPFFQKIMYLLVGLSNRTNNNRIKKLTDFYGKHIYLPLMIKVGIRFISQYSTIYTTRLHTLILGFMLGKKIYYIDNITRKLSAFSNTWLSSANNVKAINV